MFHKKYRDYLEITSSEEKESIKQMRPKERKEYIKMVEAWEEDMNKMIIDSSSFEEDSEDSILFEKQ